MKIEFTKEWCMRMAAIEGGASITAGVHAKTITSVPLENPAAISEATFAFGKLIQLLRKKGRLSLEELATKADVDLDELKKIEENPLFIPEPRTVHFLAGFFELPKKKFLQLSGLTAANDSHLVDEAIRFAASARPGVELTREEKKALQEFIAVLNEK